MSPGRRRELFNLTSKGESPFLSRNQWPSVGLKSRCRGVGRSHKDFAHPQQFLAVPVISLQSFIGQNL